VETEETKAESEERAQRKGAGMQNDSSPADDFRNVPNSVWMTQNGIWPVFSARRLAAEFRNAPC